jgi:Ca-activated chloride channel family protein
LAAGEERLYGVVVLSDGEDTASKISLDNLISTCLPSGEDVAGIKVYTIAYGSGADQKILKMISTQTNGKMFVSGVDNIREIYLSISAEQ